MTEQKKTREPLFHLVKRIQIPKWQSWSIRGGTILGGFLFIGLLIFIALGVDPGTVYKGMFVGAFGSSYSTMVLLQETALLLLFALAVTPAFKMKFWNIGAEGQVLMGAYATMLCLYYLGGKVNDVLLIFIALGGGLIGGAIWAVIPALFKAKWNTNETLFTLMMNYVAIQVIEYTIKIWAPTSTGKLPTTPFGNLPKIGGDDFWFCIIVALVLTAVLFVYLKYSKHGYEISVVGESENTARYIGINVKKVIIRTLIVSGIVHTISSTMAGGRGFTAILVSWLAKFNPLVMILSALLVVFLSRGTAEVMMDNGVTNSFFSEVVTGIIFLLIIGCEFFINYKVVFRHRNKAVDAAPTSSEDSSVAANVSVTDEAATDDPAEKTTAETVEETVETVAEAATQEATDEAETDATEEESK